MAGLSRLLALLIAFVLMPGAAELVENGVHLVSDGHAAHVVDDADHAPKGDEHGCSGAFHVCSCHSSPSFVVNVARLFVPLPTLVVSSPRGDADGRAAAGHPRSLYRPPNA